MRESELQTSFLDWEGEGEMLSTVYPGERQQKESERVKVCERIKVNMIKEKKLKEKITW